jgi:hypothetical protein
LDTEIFRARPILGLLSNAPVLIGAAAMALTALPGFRRWLTRSGDWPAVLLFAATRLLFLVLIVGVLGHVSTDMRLFFQGQGNAVLRGELPYADFESWYAPLFPYLMALPALLDLDAWPFFVAFILCDGGCLILLRRLLAHGTPGSEPAPGRDPATVRATATWIYAASPVTWYFLVRFGQDEALMGLVLAAAVVAFLARRETPAALLLALGFAATKFTFLLFVPPFVLLSERPWRFAAAWLTGVLALFLPFVLAGAPVWQPLVAAGTWLDYGPSVWRLPFYLLGVTPPWPVAIPLVVLLLAVFVAARGKARPALVDLLVLFGLLFLLFAPRVMPFYIIPIWPLAVARAATVGRAAEFRLMLVLNVLLGVWWYLDTGGLDGRYGPVAQGAAILVTALIPMALAWWALIVAARLFGGERGREPSPAGSG